MSVEDNKKLVGDIIGKIKAKKHQEEIESVENKDTEGMPVLTDYEHEAEMEKRQVKMFSEDEQGDSKVAKRESREGVWVKSGTRQPNRLRELLHKRVCSFVSDGINEHEAFVMWRNDEEVRGIIASHYNHKCRTWSSEEWIDNAKSRMRADGKAMLKRFGFLPPNFPKGIMRRGKKTDTLTSWMLMGGAKLSEIEAKDNKSKPETKDG